jgi:hypothetical protein
MSAGEGCPRAREDGLVIETIGDELLVYDTETSRAHSLNASAAAVFEACDGTRSAEQIGQEGGLDADAVGLALADLAKSGLLEGYVEPSERVSRRTVIRRLAVAGAGIGVAVPVIRSITAPTPAMAITATHKGNAGQHCTPASAGGGASAGCAPSSFCNSAPGPQQSICYRRPGETCSHPSSCQVTGSRGSIAVPCGPTGHCTSSCNSNGQCRAGYTCFGTFCHT